MFVLDTNVVSEFRRIRSGKADERVAAWAASVDEELLFLSSITIHELEVGVLRAERRDAAQGRILRSWVHQGVIANFKGRILPIDIAVGLKSAEFQVPNTQLFRDSLIAATALVHNMTVVTRNISDFERTGVRLLNPWLQSS